MGLFDIEDNVFAADIEENISTFINYLKSKLAMIPDNSTQESRTEFIGTFDSTFPVPKLDAPAPKSIVWVNYCGHAWPDPYGGRHMMYLLINDDQVLSFDTHAFRLHMINRNQFENKYYSLNNGYSAVWDVSRVYKSFLKLFWLLQNYIYNDLTLKSEHYLAGYEDFCKAKDFLDANVDH